MLVPFIGMAGFAFAMYLLGFAHGYTAAVDDWEEEEVPPLAHQGLRVQETKND